MKYSGCCVVTSCGECSGLLSSFTSTARLRCRCTRGYWLRMFRDGKTALYERPRLPCLPALASLDYCRYLVLFLSLSLAPCLTSVHSRRSHRCAIEPSLLRFGRKDQSAVRRVLRHVGRRRHRRPRCAAGCSRDCPGRNANTTPGRCCRCRSASRSCQR